jgi:endo-1,4-beta-xylanase
MSKGVPDWEDLNDFFDSSEGFAQSVLVNGAAVDGIVSTDDERGRAAEGQEVVLWLPASSAPSLPADRQGVRVRFDDVTYDARVRDEENGIVEYLLTRRRNQIVLGLMGHVADWQADASLEALLDGSGIGLYIDGNAMKWNFLVTSGPITNYDWTTADLAFAKATANGQVYRLHSIIRGTDTFYPSGYDFSTAAVRIAQNEAHAEALLTRFPGTRCEVANELLDGSGNLKNFVGVEATTLDEIEAVFRKAAEVDPTATFGICEYGCETAGAKQDGLYSLCSSLIAAGVQLDFVSFQGHIDASAPPTVEQWRATFKRFRLLGLEVDVSELDIRVSGVAGTEAVKQAAQAAAIRELAIAFRLEGGSYLGWWGAFDGKSWIYAADGTAHPDEQPLPYDTAYTAKPVWTALQEEL